MMRTLLLRGMLCGLVAGLLALGFALLAGEPPLVAGIDFEAAGDPAVGKLAEPEVVSRTVQGGLGLATGLLIYAVALGGMFALVFAVAYGRIGQVDARTTATIVALSGFLAAFVVPFLKYPGNPPGVSDPATLNDRTTLYFSMVAISIALAVAATYMGRRLAPRFGGWTAMLLAIAAYAVAVGMTAWLLPEVTEMPQGFPATVVWDFRIAALGIQVVMWATIGLLFGALVQHRLAEGRPAEAVRFS